MPFPLVIAALAAGGNLVAHASGGFIISSSAGAYVTGTYISTAAVATILSTSAGLVAGGALVASRTVSGPCGATGNRGAVVKTNGFGAVTGKTGATSLAPTWVSAVAASTRAVGRDAMAYATEQVYQMRKMVGASSGGVEVHFTESQARALQLILLSLPEAGELKVAPAGR